MAVPDSWTQVPGFPIASQSYNATTSGSNTSLSYVLPSSYFESIANISQIEFVPLTTGQLMIDIVSPVCDSGLSWCALIRACTASCATHLESQNMFDAQHTCQPGSGVAFCSVESTCNAELTCPAFADAVSAPIAYEVKESITIPANPGQEGKKQIHRLTKTLATSADDVDEAFIGFKLHQEESWTGGHFLAVRCETSPCVMLPI
eukprot:maker-scaffold798_size95657-snap-gene-0.31 protein:Tk09159 transcript:maker-scaffold798_size95657-snap-gene-0.31-mRNA-1 annotation:"zgc:103474 protein"